MKLVLMIPMLFALALSSEDGSQGRCDWNSEVTGSILGNNIAFYDNKTLAECKALCDANAACESIDFCQGKMQCYLGSCRIGKRCPNNFDPAYKNIACGREPVWLPLKDKEAAQSSEVHGGTAARAIDGNTASSWHSGSCTHTHHQNPAWWEVDLGEKVNVTDVKVTNRGDCCGDQMSPFTLKVDGKPCAEKVTISQGETKKVKCVGTGQVVRLEVPKRTHLMLCEFAVGVDPLFATTMTTTAPRVWLNLKEKDVSQSSSVHGGVATRAVDGNTASRWHSGSCTHTHHNKPAWWEVDLGEKVEVTNVKVTNRGDCCGDQMSPFTLKIDNKPCKENVRIGQGQTKNVQCIGTGRVVRLEVPSKKTHLMLCEFAVGVDPLFATTMTTTAPRVWLNLKDKAVSQSSSVHGGVATRAVDGNTASRWHSGSCTHTHHSKPAWWEVDLGEKVDITNVKVTNRGDCCGDQMSPFNLKIDNKPCNENVRIGQGQTKNVQCIGTGRVVRLEVPSKKTHLMLCEFAVGVDPLFASTMTTTPSPRWLNLKGKKAKQISTAHGGVASRAIDGNMGSRWHSRSCTHSHGHNNVWWEVDLGKKENVTEIKITNRGDCCGDRLDNFKVSVDGAACTDKVRISQGQTKRVPCTAMGQTVRVTVPDRRSIMTICEFGVGVYQPPVPQIEAAVTTTMMAATTTPTTTVITTTSTTTLTTTTTTTVAQPSLTTACSPGVCETGKWAYFIGSQTEAQCKQICDKGRKLVPEFGLQEDVYFFRQNGQFHDVSSKKVDLSRSVPNIIYHSTGGHWPGYKHRDHFYVRWTGFLEITDPGLYTFTTSSDDGSYVNLDGAKVLDNGGWHGMREKHGNAVLEFGKHVLQVDFFEGGGGAGCLFYYKGPDTGNAKIFVPTNVLTRPNSKLVANPDWKDGMCAAYSHHGDTCLLYTKCDAVSKAADDVCGAKMDWLGDYADFETCKYPAYALK